MNVKMVHGDLIEKAQRGEFDVIVHGCNCFCTMGAGIAKRIKTIFPAAYEADKKTGRGDKEKLGTCSYAVIQTIQSEVVIVNAYTQYQYGGKGQRVDYHAIKMCMSWVSKHFSGKRIGLPKIGAGLAGGDWTTILQIIAKEFNGEDVTVVLLKNIRG